MPSESGFDPKPGDPIDNIPMIYIVGNSFCGSTLFGFLLSAHPDIIFLSELKIKTWLRERSCSCGHSLDQCPFYRDYFNVFNDRKKAIFEELRPRSLLTLLFRNDKIISNETISKLEFFYWDEGSDLYQDLSHSVDNPPDHGHHKKSMYRNQIRHGYT